MNLIFKDAVEVAVEVVIVAVVVKVGSAVAAENELGVIALELEGAVKTHYTF
jgi:hypothetical protein